MVPRESDQVTGYGRWPADRLSTPGSLIKVSGGWRENWEHVSASWHQVLRRSSNHGNSVSAAAAAVATSGIGSTLRYEGGGGGGRGRGGGSEWNC